MGDISDRLTRLEVKMEGSADTGKIMNLKLDKVTARLDRIGVNGHTEDLKRMLDDWPEVRDIIVSRRQRHAAADLFARYYRTVMAILGLVVAITTLVYYLNHP